MIMNIPRITYRQFNDFIQSGRDSTGSVDDDNPLNMTNLDDAWMPPDQADLPDWFFSRIAPTLGNPNEYKNWSYVKLNDDQIACLSPIYFETFELIVLLTQNGPGIEISQPIGWYI